MESQDKMNGISHTREYERGTIYVNGLFPIEHSYNYHSEDNLRESISEGVLLGETLKSTIAAIVRQKKYG